MKLNKGDIVEIIEKDFYNETYEVGTKWIVAKDSLNSLVINVYDSRQSDGIGILFYANIKKVDTFKQNYVELVADCEEEPAQNSDPAPMPKQESTIEVRFLLDYIETEDLCLPEVKAFLKGYLKGERFKHD